MPRGHRHAGPGAPRRSSPASRSTSINYFFMLAEEAREIMAQLGFRKLQRDGRPRRRARTSAKRSRTGRRDGLDLSAHAGARDEAATRRRGHPARMKQDHGLEQVARQRPDRWPAARRSRREPRVRARTLDHATSTAPWARCSATRSPRSGAPKCLPDDTIHYQVPGHRRARALGAFLAEGRHARAGRRRQRLRRQGPLAADGS